MIIAFDGTASSGKSTIAKKVASTLKLPYVNTGEIYRSLTAYFIVKNILPNNIDETILKHININLIFEGNNCIVEINGARYNYMTRSKEVDDMVARFSKIDLIRNMVRNVQRNIQHDFVIEGRDITSVVFPNAEYKFYIDADIDERARRRYNQHNNNQTLEEIKNSLEKRDLQDKNRQNSPLILTDNTHYIDTTFDTLEESVNKIIKFIREV